MPKKAPNKKKIRKQSNQPVSKIKRECMELAKRIVSARDGDICQKCGERVYGSNRQRSHVIPVSAGNKLAFDTINMKVLCMHCHLYWWHKNPLEASEWFEAKFPERHKYLQGNKGLCQMKYQDFVDLREKLRQEMEILL
jgi:5-methylcytosine-specific restriction endonuclease McrA